MIGYFLSYAFTFVFTLVNTLLLHPLPVQDSSSLVAVVARGARDGGNTRQLPFSYLNARDFGARNQSFTTLAAYTSPPLTTVAQPKEAIGTGAAGLLLERLRDGRAEPRRAILQPELHRRASTARPQD